MPIALDPTARFELVLKSDQDKPDPPTFVFHHLSCSGVNALLRFRERIEGLKDVDAVLEELLALLKGSLVGWRYMYGLDGKEIPYAPDLLADILAPKELMELLQRLPEAMSLDPEAKKGLGSPSPSSSEGSAPTAPEEKNAGASGATRDGELTSSPAPSAKEPDAPPATAAASVSPAAPTSSANRRTGA